MTISSRTCFPLENAHDLLDAEALGQLFGLGTADRPGSAARAIETRIERGHELPPCIQLPGQRGRRWLRATVIRWIKRYETPLGARRVGRPRKIDQIAIAAKSRGQ